jgi:hypothetical protein
MINDKEINILMSPLFKLIYSSATLAGRCLPHGKFSIFPAFADKCSRLSITSEVELVECYLHLKEGKLLPLCIVFHEDKQMKKQSSADKTKFKTLFLLSCSVNSL